MTTGFLYGDYASVNPDNVERISSNVPQIYNNNNWRPLELGSFPEDSCPQNLNGTLLRSLPTISLAQPEWSSQTGYVLADCVRGAAEFCQTNLMYKQCNPYSLRNPTTDPTCTPFHSKEQIPW